MWLLHRRPLCYRPEGRPECGRIGSGSAWLGADHKGTEALSFARKLVDQRGRVTDADVDHVRRAGYSDGEINEIVANVALSIFTNYFNHGAETEIDFPTAPNP